MTPDVAARITALQTVIAELQNTLNELLATQPVAPASTGGAAPIFTQRPLIIPHPEWPDAPFGRRANNTPLEAPSYDGAGQLWRAMEAAHEFDSSRFLPGIQQGVIPGTGTMLRSWLEWETEVDRLARTPRWQAWLQDPMQGFSVRPELCQRWIGGYWYPKEPGYHRNPYMYPGEPNYAAGFDFVPV